MVGGKVMNKFRKILGVTLVLFLLVIPITSGKRELSLEGNKISRFNPTIIPVDEPSYIMGGWYPNELAEYFYDKLELEGRDHEILGGVDLEISIDGERVILHPYHGGRKEGFRRLWYVQFESNEFELGEHTLTTTWFIDNEVFYRLENSFLVIEKGAPYLYGQKVETNVVYETNEIHPDKYRLIISAVVEDQDTAPEDLTLTVIYPNDETLEIEDVYTDEWGGSGAGDGHYIDVVDVDSKITGEFLFRVTDGEYVQEKTYIVDEWLSHFDWVSPSWGEEVSGQLVLDWSHPAAEDIASYELRLGDAGTTGGQQFWSKHVEEPPYIVEDVELDPGGYWHGIFAISSKGNSIHSFTEFQIIQ
jgi:hypothetical protein